MRTKKVAINTITSIILQLATIVCGFILPKLILSNFGSDYNGITQSISQFISWIVLLRSGLAVVRTALYKPLYDNDLIKVSAIYNATKKFLKKIALIMLLFITIFAIVFPLMINSDFDYFFSFSLVLIIGLGTFAECFFGTANTILLEADQSYYIKTILSIISIILNTIMAAVLINMGYDIRIVKLASSLVYCVSPVILNIIVNKKYKIDKTVPPDNESLKNRWDAFYQQVSIFVNNNTDIIVISIFTDMNEVSVYTIYNLIVVGLKKLELAIIESLEAGFGNIIAENDMKKLLKTFKSVSFSSHFTSFVLFMSAIPLITPFVLVYTKGITDVSYNRVYFGYMICIAMYIYCVRIPYEILLSASGEFKLMKKYAIREALINILLSCFLVYKLGIIGVTIGTIIALLYSTMNYAIYVMKKVLDIKIAFCIKNIIISFVGGFFVFFVSRFLMQCNPDSYYEWIKDAIMVVMVSFAYMVVAAMLLFKEELGDIIAHFKVFIKR